MKKIVGKIGIRISYLIGNQFCKLTYIKYRNDYFFNTYFISIGEFLADQYINWISRGERIRVWADLDVKDNNDDEYLGI